LLPGLLTALSPRRDSGTQRAPSRTAPAPQKTVHARQSRPTEPSLIHAGLKKKRRASSATPLAQERLSARRSKRRGLTDRSGVPRNLPGSGTSARHVAPMLRAAYGAEPREGCAPEGLGHRRGRHSARAVALCRTPGTERRWPGAVKRRCLSPYCARSPAPARGTRPRAFAVTPKGGPSSEPPRPHVPPAARRCPE